LAGTAILLLLATPLYAQPIAVDTFPPTPTVVKTGEVFTVNYRIRYLDLTRWKEEIVIFTDQIDVNNFQSKVGEPFEVMNVKLNDLVPKNGEYWQDVLVSFRIIGKEKGLKKIPKIKFDWAKKMAGDEASELKTEEPVESLEVHINYVTTTIPTDPYLDIRDGLKLGNVSERAWLYRFVIPSTAVLFLGLWVFLMVSWLRSSQRSRAGMLTDPVAPDGELSQYVVASEALTFGQARKRLASTLNRIIGELESSRSSDKLNDFRRDICIGINALLLSAVTDLNPGDTPGQIEEKVKNSKAIGSPKNTYLSLAYHLRRQAIYLEGGLASPDNDTARLRLGNNVLSIKHDINSLRWHKMFLTGLLDKLSWKR